MKGTLARILVVEDEQIVAMDLEQCCHDLGHTVVASASSADEALVFVREHDPELVLMDINLRGTISGIEAASIIRERFQKPVIFITAYDDEATILKARVAEPYGYLLKPFDGRELGAAIQMALYRHEMELERDRLKRELEAAIAEVKTLRGLMPICAQCKKVRDDNGYWQRIESYLQTNTQVRLTHGFCPDCHAAIMRDLDRMVADSGGESGAAACDTHK
jgi:CheY-like chemotaxis protein